MPWDRRHITDIRSFSRRDFEYIFGLSDTLLPFSGIDKPIRRPLFIAQSRIMTLWFEPEYEKSTRTFGSFQGAMMRLGGSWKEFNEHESSMGKGESIEDTARMVSQHSDIIIDRHRDADHINKVVKYSSVPVINGGNGSYQHPTQTIVDLYTIRKKRGKIDNARIAVVGDLKNGRTVHSLCRALDTFDNVSVTGLYIHGCELPEMFIPKKYQACEIDAEQLDKELAQVGPDVVYVTRPQLERGTQAQEYVINERTLKMLPSYTIIMHPLPRDSRRKPEI